MKIISQNLIERKEGVVVPAPMGKEIFENSRSLIVRHLNHSNESNKLYYLLEDNICYGIVRLGHSHRVPSSGFKELSEKHNITEEMRNKWWPKKEVLFSYSVDVVTRFDSPRPVCLTSDHPNSISQEFEFSVVDEKTISNIEDYDVKIHDIKKLHNDFNIALAWYTSKRTGGKVKHDIDSIKKLAKNILFEIVSQDPEHFFDVPRMHPLSRELFNEMYKKRKKDKGCNSITEIENASAMSSTFEYVSSAEKIISPLTCWNTVSKFVDKEYEMSDNEDSFCGMLKLNKDISLQKNIGSPALIIKSSENISIINHGATDISCEYKDVHDAAHNLSSSNYIVECELYEDVGYITDVLYLDEDLTDKPWSERAHILNSLNYGETIKCMNGIIVNSPDDALKAIKLLKNLPGSFGVSAKDSLSQYSGANVSVLSERNEMFFDKWSPTMAYFLGFISTDGSLEEGRDRIEVKISSLDKDILKKLGKALGKESFQTKGGTSRFRFGSKHMTKTLKSLGFAKDKPKRTCHKHVPSKYKWMFARGVFDADGSTLKDRIQVDSGNKGLLKWLKKLFESTGGDIKLYDYDTYAKIVVLGVDSKKVLRRLYSGSSDVGLKRKIKKMSDDDGGGE